MLTKLLAAIAKKKAQQVKGFFEKAPERIDQNWPLRLSIGRTVKFEPTPFLLGEGLKMPFPAGDYSVKAAGVSPGRIEGEEVLTYRFYLEAYNLPEVILWITTSKESGEIYECMAYHVLDEIAQGIEWHDWLNENTGLIGYKDFCLPDGTSYNRAYPASDRDKVEPVRIRESITDDAFVREMTSVMHEFTLYSREIPSSTDGEFLVVSHETDDEGDFIQILVGLKLDIGAGTVGNTGFLQIL